MNIGPHPAPARCCAALLAALGYVAAVAVLLALAWSGVADMLERAPVGRGSLRPAGAARGAQAAARLRRRRAGRRPVPTGSPFLEGQTLTVAGAALLQRVADAVTKVGGNVLSSQVDVQGVQAKDGYVSVLASCEVEQAAMQRLLYDLEAGMPFLFVEQFVAQAPQTGRRRQPSGRMRLLLAVSGRWQGDK